MFITHLNIVSPLAEDPACPGALNSIIFGILLTFSHIQTTVSYTIKNVILLKEYLSEYEDRTYFI